MLGICFVLRVPGEGFVGVCIYFPFTFSVFLVSLAQGKTDVTATQCYFSPDNDKN